jgi:hypothetical protein
MIRANARRFAAFSAKDEGCFCRAWGLFASIETPEDIEPECKLLWGAPQSHGSGH